MATVNKDFKIKSGLVVEGTTGTINGLDILTKKQADQDYIVSLIGGTATSANTANTVVKRDADGNFAAGTITANLTGNASTATTLATARTIAGQSFDGSANVSIAPTDLTGVTATAAEINLLDGVTATTAELNILDGVTASASELNILDGVTASTAELNFVDGVTSAIQDQINAKAPSASPTFTGTVSGIDKTMVGLGNVDNTSDADKPVSTATQTALDLKAPLASPALTGTPTAPTAAAGTNTTQVATTAFVGTAVSNLVGSAPELLDTLQELAAAIDNDPETINNLQSLAAGKQDNLTAGDNISIDGSSVISVTGLDAADISDFSTAALAATSAAYDVAGAAAAAQGAAEDYADAKISDASSSATDKAWSAYKTATEISLAQQAATDVANSLTTDDVAEGSAQYFTDALAKSSAADLLTGASLTNITITGTGAGLTITAENGVADSDTDDLTEGSNNLYFTDERAVDALDGTTPNFVAVELGEISKNVAATTVVPVAGIATAYSWLKANYRSAEFLVKVAYGDHTEISKVLLTLAANDNISVTEYGIVGTNGSGSSSVSAVISGNDVQLQVTTTNNTSTVSVVGTLLA
jgi:hypothetical protein